MIEPIVLGIDGGGTYTRVLLVAGDGSVLGLGRTGPSNINTMGLEATVTQIREAVHSAWLQAKLEEAPVHAAFMGLAGINASGLRENLQQSFTEMGMTKLGHCIAANDSEAALAGGLSGRPGIAVIAGTGSFCLGRDAEGNMAQCGGWGWLLDDVGSGSYLGREALRAVLHSIDGRAASTSLTPRILAHAGLSAPMRIPAWLHTSQSYVKSLSSLAPIVIGEAAAGDAAAIHVLQLGARGLAELAKHVASRLRWRNSPELVIVGGVGRSGKPYQTMIEASIKEAIPGVRIVDPILPPVAGAVLRAFEDAGTPATAEMLERLRSDCARLDLN